MYQEITKLALENIQENMARHKQYPLNGYLDLAIGIKQFWWVIPMWQDSCRMI